MVIKRAYAEPEDEDMGLDHPRVLYTGTGKNYLREKLCNRKVFVHEEEKPVHLSESSITALSYAAQRAKFYGDLPLVLVVDRYKLTEELHCQGEYETMALNIGSFLPYEFTLDKNGKFAKEDYFRIRQVEELVTHSSAEEVFFEIQRFLKSFR